MVMDGVGTSGTSSCTLVPLVHRRRLNSAMILDTSSRMSRVVPSEQLMKLLLRYLNSVCVCVCVYV